MGGSRRSERRLFLAVINPATRIDATRVVAALYRHAPPDVDLEVCFTGPDLSVAQVISSRLSEASVVIACGGDGTVSAVVTALGDRDLPVGVVPCGSTNMTARENRIPIDVDAAARLIFGPHALERIDAGTCGERRVLHIAGAGLDSRMFVAAKAAWKRRAGWLAYLPAAVHGLLAPPVVFRIVAERGTVELQSSLVLIANGGGLIRRRLTVFPDIRYDDGFLDVVAFSAMSWAQKARTALRFLTRSLDRSPFVIHLRARCVRLEAEPPIPYELDGEVVGRTPATFGIIPKAVSLIVPPRKGTAVAAPGAKTC